MSSISSVDKLTETGARLIVGLLCVFVLGFILKVCDNIHVAE